MLTPRHPIVRDPRRRPLLRGLWLVGAASATTGALQAQVVFSIDYRSPTIGILGPTPITSADLLIPAPAGAPGFGPLAPPMILVPGGPLGVAGLGIPTYAGCVGVPAGAPCPRELDAVSFGADFPLGPGPILAGRVVFSVDEFAVGRPGSPLAPNCLTEAPIGDSSADVYEWLGGAVPLPAPPVPMGPAVPGHTGLTDGNGLVSGSGAVYPGLGLIEPDMPLPGPAVDGDDVDALDIQDGPAVGAGAIFFSLDAAFPDPALGLPNTGTAPANGFAPGAILATFAPGGPPVVWAAPLALGLDLAGPMTDDLDALAIFENGIAGYQAGPGGPFAWMAGADMVLYSVRRGSAVVGVPDSVFGMPIQPGDVLCTPPVAGVPPGIFIAAEQLGLATTRTNGVPFGGDDLDALDTRWMPATGLGYCFGTLATCPCGNGGAAGNGCANSVFAVGANLAATGVASVAADTVVLTGTNMPPSSALYFQGTAAVGALFGDGRRCAGGAVLRLGTKINTAAGTSSYPVAGDPPVSVRGALPLAGGTRYYQCWYRNAAAFCTASTFNLSNGLTIVWTP